ncbi:hypothetical protein TNCV_1333111 [Trichonephila clavipes]|nr:hypothetical protein TNCV_1333111 [Trichonephila clavipes]
MTPHTITPAGEWCVTVNTKGRPKAFHHGVSGHEHDSLLLLRLNPDYAATKTTWSHFTSVQFSRARHHSKRRRRWDT